MRLCLCDDDAEFLKSCKMRIGKLALSNDLELELDEYSCGESLLFAHEDDIDRYDIIVIDMIMEELTGIDTIKRLRKMGYEGEVIFLTSSEEYALASFEVYPLSYVLKRDIDKGALENALGAALEHSKKVEKKKLVLNTKSTSLILDLSEIVYFESCLRKVIIWSTRGKQEANYGITDMHEKTKECGFLRCHKSFIVNARFVKSFNKTTVYLKNGKNIPLGRVYVDEFEINFTQYIRSKMLL